VLLLPFAFRRALLSRLLCVVRSWLQGNVCFLCLPPGFPAVPPYLALTFAAFRARATMSAPTSLLHQTPGCPARRTFGVRVEAGSLPRAVGRFQRVAARRDYGHRIATPGILGFVRRDLPGSCVTLSDRAAPHHTRLLRREHVHSSAPAGGFTTLGRLAFHRTPYSRVRLPAARSFVSDPPDPASRRRPVIFDYSAQERSAETRLALARFTHCQAYVAQTVSLRALSIAPGCSIPPIARAAARIVSAPQPAVDVSARYRHR
jgi:hypothetical protein